MIPDLRKIFNSQFTETAYNNFLNDLNTSLRYPTDFRVSETPLFLSSELTKELEAACDDLILQIKSEHFLTNSLNAVPSHFKVSGDSDHPIFLQIDFAICKNETGGFIPQLIELQGFPSLYGYQAFFNDKIRKHFEIPENFQSYFSGHNLNSYQEILKQTIVGNENPENVILLEIHPEEQKTRIDFAATERLTGIKTVCLTKVIKHGAKLYYKDNGKEIPIKRIYNRVIFDELEHKNLNFNFDFRDEMEIEWVGHPNWFFRISKHSLPVLKGKYVPHCYYLNDLQSIPDDLHNYVLKPLFSFAGLGVDVEPTKEKLQGIKEKNNYILQQKIDYAPLIETPDEPSKVEIRMMFLWDKEPVLVNNLIRMSKGKMMGVDFNKNKTWVGSSIAFHP